MKYWLVILVLLGGSIPRATAEAPASTHWAFQPIRDPALPPVTNAAWCRTSIDRIILARFEASGIQPSPTTGRRTLLRRAAYDLTGLPPSADDIDRFSADPAPDAFSRVIDRLLESPHYGEHWGRHWLDVVRYADTAGETADYPVPVAWRYRNYVIDAFNQDKPYDQFLREQIAGDILARTGPRERYAEQVTATGYLAVSRRFGFDSENYHHLTLQDTIDTVGQSVLGLTLGCARCHNHKFDPVSTADYYALYGIFESTRYAFPGSEQKQRHRALVPLLPPGESAVRWEQFETRIAGLAAQVERAKLSVPGATLRSLDDLDGDFEMQAPAAGGSKGVLVPPWVYQGPIAITTEAQSPFKNLHSSGRVGASIPAGTNGYSMGQALHPIRHRGPVGTLHLNLDFRVATNDPTAGGRHRFWLGSTAANPAFEILLSAEALQLKVADRIETVFLPKAGQWHSVQLTLDLGDGTLAGNFGLPGQWIPLAVRPLSTAWNGALEQVGFDSGAGPDSILPAIAFDHLAVQESPIPPVSTTPPAIAGNGPDPAQVAAQLLELAGIDGDFELQSDDTPPSAPWGPGPNSVVMIRSGSQSPFRNLLPTGQLGIHLPNSGAYNGFGQTLARSWKSDRTDRLSWSFDFRCTDAAAGGDGSWRSYLGHGPGGSPAVELFFNSSRFFRRSGDARDEVQALQPGEWYQVQLQLDLKQRRYTGTIANRSRQTPFEGQFAPGWDGTLDYTFIDSYGHLPGVKPALDADNFTLGESPLATLDAPAVPETDDGRRQRRSRVAELRRQRDALAADAERARNELESLLVDGPFDLAYAVSEGTPHDARIQLRGEPDRPGEEVPRGFLPVLGGSALPRSTRGSGRLELADWLVHPSHPLTARVMVNRIWQYHFGEGLVRTANDFGTRGQPPSDPDLLDHLATRFIQSGWSVKAMHRLILNSAVYRMRSESSLTDPPDPMPASADECPVMPATGSTVRPGHSEPAHLPGLARTHLRRRLSAEETRDSLLRVSGELDTSTGHGHPFPSPTRWGYTQHGPFNAVYDHQRRSVYLMNQRIKRHPFLALFDGPDPNASTAGRRTTTVPTQALYFLNDPFVHTCAKRFAARVEAAAPDEAGRIQTAWRMAFGRMPTAEESAEAAQFLAASREELVASGVKEPTGAALASFARVLFGSNEFLTVD